MNEAKRMDRQALTVAQTPAFVRRYAQFLVIAFFVLPIFAMFLPWRQNVIASGQGRLNG